MVTDVDAIVRRFDSDRGQLVSILQDIQDEYRYLPKDALEKVSQALAIPLSQVYSVVTFFRAFSLEPRGRHLIKVCLGTACHVRGGNRIMERMALELDIDAGETTDDLAFTLESVNCLGCCALGPVAVIDDATFGQMTTDKVAPLLERYK
jgi:NADH-quinone oxidoreductase subunit E